MNNNPSYTLSVIIKNRSELKPFATNRKENNLKWKIV